MLTQKPTENMIKKWKEIFNEYKEKITPNKKAGLEIVKYLEEHYSVTEVQNSELTSIVESNIKNNEFNLKYKFGHYYKVIDFKSEKIIGGIFIFELDNPHVMQIAQFYIDEEFRHMGIGKLVFEAVMDKHSDVNTWYVDTILEEDHNVNFYKQAGFVEIEREVEHEGLSFVTLIKKR